MPEIQENVISHASFQPKGAILTDFYLPPINHPIIGQFTYGMT